MTQQDKNREFKTQDVYFTDGEVFEVPGVRGRMDRLEFSGELTLYRLEFEALEDCVLNFHPSFEKPWIGSAFHLQGHSVMTQADGQEDVLDSEHAVLMRVDTTGTAFRLTQGVLIRHLGVSITIKALNDMLGDLKLDVLDDFAAPFGKAIVIKPVVPSKKMQQLASTLFSFNARGHFRQFKLEGAARLFMAEMLELYCQEPPLGRGLNITEEQIVKSSIQFILKHLDKKISIDRLAEEHKITTHRLNWIFKQRGMSVAEYIRNERLLHARKLLFEADLPVKTVANMVGYQHVANFTRAYANKFGEPPSRTRQQKG